MPVDTGKRERGMSVVNEIKADEKKKSMHGCTRKCRRNLTSSVPNIATQIRWWLWGLLTPKKSEAGKAILGVCERVITPSTRHFGEYKGKHI